MAEYDGHWRGPWLGDIRTIADGGDIERVHAHSGTYQMGRPAIVDQQTLTALTHDIATVMAALVKLRQILADGDIRRFWTLLGYDQAKQDLIGIGHREDMLGKIGRCDLFQDASGFKLLEVNSSSAVGALDSRLLMDAYLRDQRFAEHVKEAGLSFIDPAQSLGSALLATFPEVQAGPMVLLDHPDSYAVSHQVHDFLAALLSSHGVETFSGSLGDVEVRGGQATCQGRPFALAYRVFQGRELTASVAELEHWSHLLRELDAVDVPMVLPLSSTSISDKRSLALLQSDLVQPSLGADEREVVARMLPRSVIVSRGETFGCDEKGLDWLRVAQQETILKPCVSSSGKGIVYGRDLDRAEWETLIATPPAGGYVAQELVHPLAEAFPNKDGSESMWQVQSEAFHVWGDVIPASARAMRFGYPGPMRSLFRGEQEPPQDAAVGGLMLVAE